MTFCRITDCILAVTYILLIATWAALIENRRRLREIEKRQGRTPTPWFP
jgi:hypothetical protein